MKGNRLRETWTALEPRGQLTLVGAGLAVIVVFYLLFNYAASPSYTTLSSNLDPATTAQAEKALAGSGISYKIESGGTQIAVKSGQESQARVALASKGVLQNGQPGFELFDKKSLGTTDFQQQVDYQRALEGEIARQIEQIQGVSSADVQLVLPQDNLFADQQSKASAAVLIQGGSSLDASTVSGLAHLVSSSVKALDPSNVTITDETGALLWPTSSAGGTSATSKLEADTAYSAQVAAQINQLLNSTLGANKAIARVHADLNVDQTTVDKVTYAKKGTPLSQQSQLESLQSKGGAGAALPSGTTTNTPTYAAGAAAGGNGQSQYKHQTSDTTFGVDKTIEHSIVAPGTVDKLDVALLVDNKVPAAQVAQLQKSVASLAGITPSRGDTLAVSRIAFAPQTAAAPAKASPLAALGSPGALAKGVLVVLGSIVFLFLMRRALRKREGEESVPEPKWIRELQSGMTVAQLEAAPAQAALPKPVSRANDALAAELDQITKEHPQAVAAQVTQWMKD